MVGVHLLTKIHLCFGSLLFCPLSLSLGSSLTDVILKMKPSWKCFGVTDRTSVSLLQKRIYAFPVDATDQNQWPKLLRRKSQRSLEDGYLAGFVIGSFSLASGLTTVLMISSQSHSVQLLNSSLFNEVFLWTWILLHMVFCRSKTLFFHIIKVCLFLENFYKWTILT